MIYPVEIKKTTNPTKEHLNNFSVLDKIKSINIGTGGIICLYDKMVHLTDKNVTIPVTWL